MHERLLVVAHGTASPVGIATTEGLVAALAAARPDFPVELCYLDVAEPRLPQVLDDRPTIAVPLLLSTGYHAQADIPAACSPYPAVRVARHLGPHPLLVEALVDRLAESSPDPAASVVLAAAGSSRAEAATELAQTAQLLARRLGRPVETVTVADDLPAFFANRAHPLAVSTYLLAEGQFLSTLAGAVAAVGAVGSAVAPPLGVHPALVRLVWQRYDEVRAPGRLSPVAD
ncbi:sirohydrochlorin chelatase [uncultured Jatrophihabitans sp.]|uniref:sirohydrochlorin chelatase n=1 Tax=uncultured Jatrophihabitans sp. TaxID=1610747 RepID=UPI0035CB5648